MDSHTERHEVLSDHAQKQAEYNKEVRQHVRDIAVSLGLALGSTLRFGVALNTNDIPAHNQRILVERWEDVAGNVCAFTEFLDEN